MGITNFCKLIDSVSPPSSEPEHFDSVLVDCQSWLYIAINHSLHVVDEDVFQEVCESTWDQLLNLLKTFVHHKCASKDLTLVLSFDGEGVPMKWITQRNRRQSKLKNEIITAPISDQTLFKKGSEVSLNEDSDIPLKQDSENLLKSDSDIPLKPDSDKPLEKDSEIPSKKSLYRNMLFGHNKLTLRVQNYLKENLKQYNCTLRVVIAGSNVPGEGEHKIFQTAEAISGCRNPIVVSVDQDVFILAFLRLSRYETIQIYRYKKFYNVTRFATQSLPYPLPRLISASFLFGNDFIPCLLSISPSNVSSIHNCLEQVENEDPPTILAVLLKNVRIRFTSVEFVDRNLIVWFWMTYFWILDYYTERYFPQQFLQNHIYDAFDRNMLLTGLLDEEFSREVHLEAKEKYHNTVTYPVPNAEKYVFTDSNLLNHLKSYWIKPENGVCCVLKLTSSGCTKRKLLESPATGIGKFPKMKTI